MQKSLSASRAAFTALAHRYESALLCAARRLCRGDEDRAQDLTQDTLIRAYQATLDGKFSPGTHARAWMLRILTNLFINDYRRRQKWDAGIDLDTLTSFGTAGPAATHAAPHDIPGTTLLAETLDEELEQALNTLTEPLRHCIILVDIEGLDYAEAAAALRIPIGTVRSRLSRARMQMHDLLMDYARRKGLLP